MRRRLRQRRVCWIFVRCWTFVLQITGLGEGFEIVAESNLGRTVNVEFADVDEDTLDRHMNEIVQKIEYQRVEVVSTICTNLRAAQRVPYWEEKYPGLIVADTTTTVL